MTNRNSADRNPPPKDPPMPPLVDPPPPPRRGMRLHFNEPVFLCTATIGQIVDELQERGLIFHLTLPTPEKEKK